MKKDENIKISDLTVHAASNKMHGIYIYFDVYYAGMKIGKVNLLTNNVELHEEKGVFDYEENIINDLIKCTTFLSNVNVYLEFCNNTGFVKLINILNLI